jgi:arsenate reductase
MKIYHNPRCSKSRAGLKLIQEAGKVVEIVEYLKTPPTEKELKEILNMLEMKPLELMRKNEAIYKEQFKGKEFTDDQWIKIMVENPKLIERPIVVKGKRAVLGRPTEKIEELF